MELLCICVKSYEKYRYFQCSEYLHIVEAKRCVNWLFETEQESLPIRKNYENKIPRKYIYHKRIWRTFFIFSILTSTTGLRDANIFCLKSLKNTQLNFKKRHR